MTRIWWCEEHGDNGNEERCGWQWVGSVEVSDDDNPCRMVAMRLIPDNAETVERIEAGVGLALLDSGLEVNGRWTKAKSRAFAETVLAALDGETP